MTTQQPANFTDLDKVRYSLGRSLLGWFLLLSLLPLMVTAWLGYDLAADGLTRMAAESMEHESEAKMHFIQSWFDHRVMDLNSQVESRQNAEFLAKLKKSFEGGDKTLPEFVKSYSWASLVDSQPQSLVNFVRRYDFIQNLFLIDNNGNILYTVTPEPGLGTNLYDGTYAGTFFAQSAKASLETGQILFSDLQRNDAINDLITGYLSAPVFDQWGSKIGVFSIQLRLDEIKDQLQENHHTANSWNRYLVSEQDLVNEEGLTNEDNVLLPNDLDENENKRRHSLVRSYQINRGGKTVIGTHQIVRLPGVNWVLVSEIAQEEALMVVHNLGQIILAIIILTAALVTGFAIYLARRITQPIIQLADASMAVAAGEKDQQVVVKANNEIGLLAGAFNHMLKELSKHEQALEQSIKGKEKALTHLAELKSALDQHAIVAVTDGAGYITYANDKFTEISGYNPDEFLGQTFRLLNSRHHDSSFYREMYKTLGNGESWHGEICNKRKDGHLYWMDTTAVPFMGEDGKVESGITILTDITRLKQAESELMEAKEAAESATRQKSDFLANMSHEIRTPMNGIIGMTGLLMDTKLTSKQHSYVTATMHSADALLTIINDILDFSKIEAGKLELDEVSFDLQSLAEDVTELMGVKCQEKGLDMLLRYKPGTERFVIGDPGRIRQILLNLLSNAIKFTSKGHILLTLDSIASVGETIWFQVTVQDTGIGIAPEKLKHIFSKFDQEDSSTTRKYGGTGLGLSICQQLCTLMHGNIEVDSKKGKGSTFTFRIQLGVSTEQPADYSSLEKYEQLKGLRVLIVDDTAIARTIFIEQLSALQMRLCGVASGEAAIYTLKRATRENDPFDIVITDYHMHEMDGETLALKISQLNLLPDGVMIFATSSPRKGEGARLKAIGFKGYLTKPIHPSEVPQILSLIWDAQLKGREIPLVTRYTIQEAKAGGRRKILLTDAQILLAEDNPINVAVATELLEGYGCTVTPAGNGLEAVTLVKERRFDLIFMDCQMPEMDGFEATEEIRKLQTKASIERTPIVAFTANARKIDQEKCLETGMDDYLSKPVGKHSFEDMLTKWIPRKVTTVLPVEEDEQIQPHKQPTEEMIEHSDTLDLNALNTLKDIFGGRFPGIMEKYIQNTLENVNHVEAAIQQGDLKLVQKISHSLKGICGQFGARHLTSVAVEMEALAESGELDNTRMLLPELRTAQEQLTEMLLQHMAAEVG